jgi:hypothetical protein
MSDKRKQGEKPSIKRLPEVNSSLPAARATEIQELPSPAFQSTNESNEVGEIEKFGMKVLRTNCPITAPEQFSINFNLSTVDFKALASAQSPDDGTMCARASEVLDTRNTTIKLTKLKDRGTEKLQPLGGILADLANETSQELRYAGLRTMKKLYDLTLTRNGIHTDYCGKQFVFADILFVNSEGEWCVPTLDISKDGKTARIDSCELYEAYIFADNTYAVLQEI